MAAKLLYDKLTVMRPDCRPFISQYSTNNGGISNNKYIYDRIEIMLYKAYCNATSIADLIAT